MKIAAIGSFVLAVWMALHFLFVLRPQIRESERKLHLPEFQGTAHQQTIRFAFRKLQRSCVRVRVLALIFSTAGFLCLLFSL